MSRLVSLTSTTASRKSDNSYDSYGGGGGDDAATGAADGADEETQPLGHTLSAYLPDYVVDAMRDVLDGGPASSSSSSSSYGTQHHHHHDEQQQPSSSGAGGVGGGGGYVAGASSSASAQPRHDDGRPFRLGPSSAPTLLRLRELLQDHSGAAIDKCDTLLREILSLMIYGSVGAVLPSLGLGSSAGDTVPLLPILTAAAATTTTTTTTTTNSSKSSDGGCFVEIDGFDGPLPALPGGGTGRRSRAGSFGVRVEDNGEDGAAGESARRLDYMSESGGGSSSSWALSKAGGAESRTDDGAGGPLTPVRRDDAPSSSSSSPLSPFMSPMLLVESGSEASNGSGGSSLYSSLTYSPDSLPYSSLQFPSSSRGGGGMDKSPIPIIGGFLTGSQSSPPKVPQQSSRDARSDSESRREDDGVDAAASPSSKQPALTTSASGEEDEGTLIPKDLLDLTGCESPTDSSKRKGSASSRSNSFAVVGSASWGDPPVQQHADVDGLRASTHLGSSSSPYHHHAQSPGAAHARSNSVGGGGTSPGLRPMGGGNTNGRDPSPLRNLPAAGGGGSYAPQHVGSPQFVPQQQQQQQPMSGVGIAFRKASFDLRDGVANVPPGLLAGAGSGSGVVPPPRYPQNNTSGGGMISSPGTLQPNGGVYTSRSGYTPQQQQQQQSPNTSQYGTGHGHYAQPAAQAYEPGRKQSNADSDFPTLSSAVSSPAAPALASNGNAFSGAGNDKSSTTQMTAAQLAASLFSSSTRAKSGITFHTSPSAAGRSSSPALNAVSSVHENLHYQPLETMRGESATGSFKIAPAAGGFNPSANMYAPGPSASYQNTQYMPSENGASPPNALTPLQNQVQMTAAHLLQISPTDLSPQAALTAATLANGNLHLAHYILSRAYTAKPVCRHLLTTGCYRSDCVFEHDVDGHTCLFWLRGRCNKEERGSSGGDGKTAAPGECSFYHGFGKKLMDGYVPPKEGEGGGSSDAPGAGWATSARADEWPAASTHAGGSKSSSSSGASFAPNVDADFPSLGSASGKSSGESDKAGGSGAQPFSFAKMAKKGYDGKSSFGKQEAGGVGGQQAAMSSPVIVIQGSSASVTVLSNAPSVLSANSPPASAAEALSSGKSVKIPQDLWTDTMHRDARAFDIVDPIQRYKYVSSSSQVKRQDSLDLHFQSRATAPVVLAQVLPQKLAQFNEVWVIVGTGHHIEKDGHQKGGGTLGQFVAEYLVSNGYEFKIGKDKSGFCGAYLVKRKKAQTNKQQFV